MGVSPGRKPWWLVAMCIFLISACQTTARLSPEEEARLARWHPIDIVDVDLNLPVLVTPDVSAAERRIQWENVIEDRLRIGVGKGRVETVHAVEASFDDELDRHLGSAEFFLARMIEAFDSGYDGHQELREVRHRTRKSKGFAATVNIKDERDRCFFAIVAYRMKGGAVHAADFGNMDTIVTILHCDPAVAFSRFYAVLESVEVVVDRAAFVEALRRKLNALPGGFRGGGRET